MRGAFCSHDGMTGILQVPYNYVLDTQQGNRGINRIYTHQDRLSCHLWVFTLARGHFSTWRRKKKKKMRRLVGEMVSWLRLFRWALIYMSHSLSCMFLEFAMGASLGNGHSKGLPRFFGG